MPPPWESVVALVGCLIALLLALILLAELRAGGRADADLARLAARLDALEKASSCGETRACEPSA